MSAQINLLDEIIVDNFAGGGGASTGIELACGIVLASSEFGYPNSLVRGLVPLKPHCDEERIAILTV